MQVAVDRVIARPGHVAIEDAVERLTSELHWAIDLVLLIVLLLFAGIGLPRAFLSAAPEDWIEDLARFSNALARYFNPLLKFADLLATPMLTVTLRFGNSVLST